MSKMRQRVHSPARRLPTTWDGLTKLHPLRPVRDEVDLGNATEIIDQMAGHALTQDQEDYLDSLSTLVEAYENEHHPVDVELRGIAALAALLDEHQMSASDLGRLLGLHRSAASKMLRGERSLTTKHIRTLSDHFRVSADLFVD